MLAFKIFKNDINRKKTSTIVLFIFLFISSTLASSGAVLIKETSGALKNFFQAAAVPDFIQMHAGDIDRDEVKNWVFSHEEIKDLQILEMLSIKGSQIYLSSQNHTLADGIMDISFIVQNNKFDFLLGDNNLPANPSAGEIFIPVYYMKKFSIKKGDLLILRLDGLEKTFTIKGTAKDAQMNPSIIHSKRFLLNIKDYREISRFINDKEYIIEFLFNNPEDTNSFSKKWASSDMPKKGPAVDKNIFIIMNAITEGMASAGILFLSFIILIIALLCLRFIMIASLEEDTHEIASMKAIGIPKRTIRNFLMFRYLIIALIAGITGSFSGLALSNLLNKDISLYFGATGRDSSILIPVLLTAALTYFITYISCYIILLRFNRISPVEAFRSTANGKSEKPSNFFKISRFGMKKINLFLSISGIAHKKRQYLFLMLIFFFCTTVSLIPIHFLTTMQSPDFITYMGIGRSDIRIDLRQSKKTKLQYQNLILNLNKDSDIRVISPHFTKQYILINEEDIEEPINIENGNFSIFPLDFIKGRSPEMRHEIALSALKAHDLNKNPGDKIKLKLNDKTIDLTVTGIYQDITNGGRTAKAVLPDNPSNALWYTINISLKDKTLINNKVKLYSSLLKSARVTGVNDYIQKTLGETISQIRRVTLLSVISGFLTAILITSLFLKMLIAKNIKNSAIMKASGFTDRDITIQYFIQIAICLFIGITLGSFFSNTIGQNIAGIIWSFMGAPSIEFIINPVLTYLAIPFLMTTAVLVSSGLSIQLKNVSIAEIIKE